MVAPMATQTNKASEKATDMLGEEEPVVVTKNNLISTQKDMETDTASKLVKGQVNIAYECPSGATTSAGFGYGHGCKMNGYGNGYGSGEGYSNGVGNGV